MQIITGMRLFILAAQHGSLAAAARQAGLTTASVSRQVGALEGHLRTRLFNRGTRGLTLTEAGETLLRRATPLLEELDDTIDSVSLLHDRPRGLLRVSVCAVLASYRIVPALERFLATHPDLKIDLLISNDESADLFSENLDVDIRYTCPDSSDLVAKLLAPSRLILVASPVYLAKHGVPRSVVDLENHETILYEPMPPPTLWELSDPHGVVHRIRPRAKFRTDNGMAMQCAILAGIGIGMMPKREVDPELASGALVRVLPEHDVVSPLTHGEGIYAVYQRSRYQPGKLRCFLSFLVEIFADVSDVGDQGLHKA
jgi:DNA-binding transcriptional LysR family regulator